MPTVEIIPFRLAYRTTKLARFLGVDPMLIRQAMRTGQLEGVAVGGRGNTLVLGRHLQGWLDHGSPRYSDDSSPLMLEGFSVGSPELNRIAYKLREAASLVSLSAEYLVDEINRGELVAKRVGKPYLIPARSLSSWLNQLPPPGDYMDHWVSQLVVPHQSEWPPPRTLGFMRTTGPRKRRTS